MGSSPISHPNVPCAIGAQETAVLPLFDRPRSEVAAGAVHVPSWLPSRSQAALVRAWRDWATPPAGMRHTLMPNGSQMSVQTVCLGWHWRPYAYSKTVDDGDGAPVKPLPAWLVDLGRRAVAEAYGDAGTYRPDVALVNYYRAGARMGMHADRDEKSGAPVVSLSIGDSCVFRFGNVASRNRPWVDLELVSGDLFVFGGPARLAHHAVVRTHAGTAPPELGLEGRLNITLRESGLSPS
ncbi:MAG: alpha-ketoglutarate-dependent dioxygenase AlkB [Actinomycetota bacterium]|nr:alpha-ketoglutarate-dependent dioxygenase AlkB [Actinomycetota bacterium]